MVRGPARALALAAVLAASATTARAQVIVGGGVIVDDDRTNSRLTEDVAASWAVVLGVDLMPHLGVRITLDAPRQTRSRAEGIYTRPPSAFPVHERLTRTHRSLSVSVLADVHGQISRRVRIAATCGLARVTHDEEVVVVRGETRPDGSTSPLPDLRQAGDFDWTGLAFGVEMPLRVTSRLEIVPELRTIYFIPSDSPDPYIIRTGVGLRWRF